MQKNECEAKNELNLFFAQQENDEHDYKKGRKNVKWLESKNSGVTPQWI